MTEHRPLVQPADVQHLLDHGATTIIIAQGFIKDTRKMLGEKGVDPRVLANESAVQLYNDLRKTEPVGALTHSTC